MIILIAFIIIGGLLVFAGYDGYDTGMDVTFGAFFGILAGFLASMLIGRLIYDDKADTHVVARAALVSMADGSDTHGHFFLGSGSIDSNPSFTWYEKNGDNSYVRRNASADSSAVHYAADDQKPYYVRSKKCSAAGGFIQPLALNANSGCWGTHYDFYIPKGSILQSYKLDNR